MLNWFRDKELEARVAKLENAKNQKSVRSEIIQAVPLEKEDLLDTFNLIKFEDGYVVEKFDDEGLSVLLFGCNQLLMVDAFNIFKIIGDRKVLIRGSLR